MSWGIPDAAFPSDLSGKIISVDPERWLAVAYAPVGKRAGLGALFALDVTLGNVVASTTEPMIGAMRLAWWREAIEKLAGGEAPAEMVLQALDASLVRHNPGIAPMLAAMVDGWLALIEVDPLDEEALEIHAQARGAALFALAARHLGQDGLGEDNVRQWGRGWALVDLAARLSQPEARDRAIMMARRALMAKGRGPRPLRALMALARRDAGTNLRARRPGSPGRQLRMFIAFLGR